jgi:hypothetical protein
MVLWERVMSVLDDRRVLLLLEGQAGIEVDQGAGVVDVVTRIGMSVVFRIQREVEVVEDGGQWGVVPNDRRGVGRQLGNIVAFDAVA